MMEKVLIAKNKTIVMSQKQLMSLIYKLKKLKRLKKKKEELNIQVRIDSKEKRKIPSNRIAEWISKHKLNGIKEMTILNKTQVS